MGNIRQNIAIAHELKAVSLVATIAGVTGLWPAIMADTGAAVRVTARYTVAALKRTRIL